ncbi:MULTISPECIES: phosphoglycolate phosphatase [Haloarcula]|uniref:Phosphoglycolate phosphatase n=1 Tax=Haloarcula pellucida TaxID=1427151 RepID=A0A830GMG0_9EURY|nr:MULTISPECIES: phosphoglycolate phosphatase [Halomicroarcula]MBX0348154.1 phosphoglycolate phosphatase [Halomicroarcula pellucida]MDS0277998.1 phosphoglycolate phosphatase [Halomicroarcula sp. S1AR25-4]GGN97236.1 phosphoglycolate phosphatase [Halomicroarcula pellucida]
MSETPPLLVDIDGTLTDESRAIDPRVFPVLREWPETVVIATGKAMPFPIALCEFLGIERTVVAENGGVVFVEATDELQLRGDHEASLAVAEAYRELGHELGFGAVDLANRWRETEIVVSLNQPLEPLERVAEEFGLVVLDTGFAYHVTDPSVDKGTGLAAICAELEMDPSSFLAVGDSENDAEAFDVAGEAIAVANADETAKARADRVTEARYADGFLEAVAPYRP